MDGDLTTPPVEERIYDISAQVNYKYSKSDVDAATSEKPILVAVRRGVGYRVYVRSRIMFITSGEYFIQRQRTADGRSFQWFACHKDASTQCLKSFLDAAVPRQFGFTNREVQHMFTSYEALNRKMADEGFELAVPRMAPNTATGLSELTGGGRTLKKKKQTVKLEEDVLPDALKEEEEKMPQRTTGLEREAAEQLGLLLERYTAVDRERQDLAQRVADLEALLARSETDKRAALATADAVRQNLLANIEAERAEQAEMERQRQAWVLEKSEMVTRLADGIQRFEAERERLTDQLRAVRSVEADVDRAKADVLMRDAEIARLRRRIAELEGGIEEQKRDIQISLEGQLRGCVRDKDAAEELAREAMKDYGKCDAEREACKRDLAAAKPQRSVLSDYDAPAGGSEFL